MSLFDHINIFPRDLVAVQMTVKLHRAFHRWLQEEARKQGMTVDRYVAHIIEEKAKEGQDGEATSRLEQ